MYNTFKIISTSINNTKKCNSWPF